MKEKILSYAQDFEDLILYHVFHDVKDGFYIDVGANHPWDLSVTKLFYDSGWRGINIEPQQDMYECLCEDRPRDININCGAGNAESELIFYVSGLGTTCDVSAGEELRKRGEIVEERTIPVHTLAKILDNNFSEKDSSQPIHFLKVDVEGFEREVLEGMDFSRWRPWVIIMEATLPGTQIPCQGRFEPVLFENGYDFVMQHGINRYYCDKSKAYLKERFIPAKEICELYHVYFLLRNSRTTFNEQQMKFLTENKYYKFGRMLAAPARFVYQKLFKKK